MVMMDGIYMKSIEMDKPAIHKKHDSVQRFHTHFLRVTLTVTCTFALYNLHSKGQRLFLCIFMVDSVKIYTNKP